MGDEGIVENAARIGEEVLGPGLADIAERHRCVGEVRGLGVFWAVELVADQADQGAACAVRRNQRGDERGRRGVQAGRHASVCELQPDPRRPPCTVSEQEAREGLAILDTALGVAAQASSAPPPPL